MRTLVALSALAVLGACAAPTRTDEASRRDEIDAATAAWRAAYDSRDAGSITAQYAPDAVLWGTTAKTVAATPAAIADYFKDASGRPSARVAFGEQHIRVYGDIAANTGYYTFSDVRDGKESSLPARFSFVFRRSGDKWLIVEHHSSRLPQ